MPRLGNGSLIALSASCQWLTASFSRSSAGRPLVNSVCGPQHCPLRSILSAAERESLVAISESQEEGLIRHYTFSEPDLAVIRQRYRPANRLGFAIQLCYMRYPGVTLRLARRAGGGEVGGFVMRSLDREAGRPA